MIAPLSKQGQLERLLNNERDTLSEELSSRGALYEHHAGVSADGCSLSISTEDGAKSTNQDASLLFLPGNDHHGLKWAATISDGVSSSVHSEQGSRWACHAALDYLSRHYSAKRASRPWPVKSCLRLFEKLGQTVVHQSERFQPPRLSNSVWSRVLRDARFAQCTLMVAWEDKDGLSIEGIGDGGFVLSVDGPSLSYLPSSDGSVNCLSPCGSHKEPDYLLHFRQWNALAMFTDGVTPLVSVEGLMIPGYPERDGEGAAAAVLDSYQRSYPKLIRDNLSLFTAMRSKS